MPRSLRLTLKSAYETLVISAPTVVDAALGRASKTACDARLASWSRRIVLGTPIDVEVSGREHIGAGETYLIMSNHQSHYDVPVLFHVLGSNLRMIAKQELFGVPIFGAALRGSGFISIDRSNREAAIKSLEEAKPILRGGTSLWLAPEGTRSRTGELGPFKKGGFVLALELGLPILPISIDGTFRVMPKGSLHTTPGQRVNVTIHPPIDVGPYRTGQNGHGRDALMARVRQVIAGGIG